MTFPDWRKPRKFIQSKPACHILKNMPGKVIMLLKRQEVVALNDTSGSPSEPVFMDRRTFVKASCVGSASLFLDGLDPKAFGEPSPCPSRRRLRSSMGLGQLRLQVECRDCFPDGWWKSTFCRRLRLLKELMHGFMVQRGAVLFFAREEVGFVIRVEVDAQRFVDPRLPRSEGCNVLVTIAVVEHTEWPHRQFRFRRAGEQATQFFVGKIEAGEELPPDLVEPFQPCASLCRQPGSDWSSP